MAIRAAERWKTKERFFEVFHVSRQTEITRNEDVCFREDVLPWLKAINEAYGEDVAEDFVTIQIVNLSEFSGATDKIGAPQARELAQMVVNDFPYLNPAEIMLFCKRFKQGRYERFYKTVDPMAILRSLGRFVEERNVRKETLAKEARKRQQAEEDALNPPMTYEEYKSLKLKSAKTGQGAIKTNADDKLPTSNKTSAQTGAK